METQAAAKFTDAQQRHVAHYLAHSDAVANVHYRMRDCSTVVATANLLDSLVG